MTDDIELPKLPGEWVLHTVHPDDYRYGHIFGYRAGDMQAYARAAVLADRDRRAQPAPGAWQPIETAARPFPGEPGFGVRLLVVVDCGEGTLSHVRVCWWQGDRWSFDSHHGSIESLGYRATHWMPLPSPPTPSEQPL